MEAVGGVAVLPERLSPASPVGTGCAWAGGRVVRALVTVGNAIAGTVLALAT
jgi:hypothetical protein